MRPILFAFLVTLLALGALAHLPGRTDDPCLTNADCLRRRLPLLKPKRLHRGAQSPDGHRRAFDPITIGGVCSPKNTPTPSTKQLQPGIYQITVTGAQGGQPLVTAGPTLNGGKGARLAVTYNITAPITLDLLPGCQGESDYSPTGGGGGSFVAVGTVPLVVAGGGGGGFYDQSGGDASATYTTFGSGSPNNVPPQSTPGQGGLVANRQFPGAGGGGFSGDGGNNSQGSSTGGRAYLNGGQGGTGSGVQAGGAGGGGAGASNGAGGGGGYTGGAGGGYNQGTPSGSGIGGAGGSYYDAGTAAISSFAVLFAPLEYSVAGVGNGQIVIQQTA